MYWLSLNFYIILFLYCAYICIFCSAVTAGFDLCRWLLVIFVVLFFYFLCSRCNWSRFLLFLPIIPWRVMYGEYFLNGFTEVFFYVFFFTFSLFGGFNHMLFLFRLPFLYSVLRKIRNVIGMFHLFGELWSKRSWSE